MAQSLLDPCLFFRKKETELIDLIGNLASYSLVTGTAEFSMKKRINQQNWMSNLEIMSSHLPFEEQ